ncbi:hypothetical protein, partial [Actibacterium pelagium]|uniref:hypothetical protein n=1 Tax=Actibacterium pelagium TaxID=2029103 RepID=UPI001E384B38
AAGQKSLEARELILVDLLQLVQRGSNEGLHTHATLRTPPADSKAMKWASLERLENQRPVSAS